MQKSNAKIILLDSSILTFSEIGLDSNAWIFIPSNMSSPDEDEIMTARGNCYHTCFQEDLPEITIHSIMGFGSKHVEKMKIVKTTGSEVERFNNNTREARSLRK